MSERSFSMQTCPRCGDERLLMTESAWAEFCAETGGDPQQPQVCDTCNIGDLLKGEREVGYASAVEDGFGDGGRRRDWDEDNLADPRRYEGRLVDLAPLLAAPAKPVPWRVHGVVADGTLTILSGESGSGKSWLAQALCDGVSRGRSVAGLGCKLGRALYVDGEMGPAMFVDQRLRPTGITAPRFEYLDASGLDFSKPADLEWLGRNVDDLAAKLVVIDSLRVLAPSKSENDSDDMAPVVSAIAKLARNTGAAVLLIHHKGDSSEKLYRGSTAIRDQADALFGLLRHSEDTDLRRLRCKGGGKMRYAIEPEDVYLRIAPAEGGVAAASAPPRASSEQRDERVQAVLDALTNAVQSEREIAAEAEVPKTTTRRILRELETSGEAVQTAGGWTTGWTTENPSKSPLSEGVVHVVQPLGAEEVDHPADDGGAA